MSILGDIIAGFTDGARLAMEQSNFRQQMAFNASEAVAGRQFSHDEAQLAYERELQADSSKYQRQVSDMKAAGLNPILAAGGSAGSVHASPASPVSGSAPNAPNLGSLLQSSLAVQQMRLQERALSIQEKEVDAKVNKTNEETYGLKIENWIKENSKELEVDSRRLENEFRKGRIKVTEAEISKIHEEINLMQEQEQSEGVKRGVMLSQKVLNEASADQIVQMLPYQKALADAQSSEAKAAAALAWAHEAYQRGLIEKGYLDNFCREMVASADKAESDAALAGVKAAIQTGDYSHSHGLGYVPGISEFATGVSNALGIIGNVFSGVLK